MARFWSDEGLPWGVEDIDGEEYEVMSGTDAVPLGAGERRVGWAMANWVSGEVTRVVRRRRDARMPNSLIGTGQQTGLRDG